MADRSLPIEDAVKTYRYLRIGTVIAVLLLAVSLVREIQRNKGCVLGSISAYYYTPVHAVFVGGLITIGFSLIVLQGKGAFEDACLNFAGMLAPVVALVPTTPSTRCDAVNVAHYPATSAAERQLGASNNMLAMLVVGAVALIVALILALAVNGGRANAIDRIGMGAVRAWLVTVAAVTVIAALVRFDAHGFYDDAHFDAAYTMFGFLFAVVCGRAAANRQNETKNYALIYGGIAGAMVVGAVLARLLGGDHRVFIAEASEISLFLVFWIVQTIEMWDPESTGPRAAQIADPSVT